MPSTRKQKAKGRSSREMDILFDFDNMVLMLGHENIISIERVSASKVFSHSTHNEAINIGRTGGTIGQKDS